MRILSIKKIFVSAVFAAVLVLPTFWPIEAMSSGYQEEKLFDSDFYTQEDLRQKIEHHNKEIKTLNSRVKALNTDIDWLVLKINQIEDSGRMASASLKESIRIKEKKAGNLLVSKNRLEYLVQYYSAMLDSKKEKDLQEIFKNKIGEIKKQNLSEGKKDSPETPVSYSPIEAQSSGKTAMTESDLDPYDGVSKKELETAIQQAGLNDWVEVVGTGSCLRLETTLPILFPTGSATLAPEYKTFFRKLAGFLNPYDVKVLVNGYADKVPINNKTYPSNFELGATRAANIVHQLVGYGLKPSIFRIESTGKYRFASKQMSDQKTLERRAEVTVIFSG